MSYVNNFADIDLEIELGEKFVLSFALDYEHYDWLSKLPDDERYGACEQIFQGEAQLLVTWLTATPTILNRTSPSTLR